MCPISEALISSSSPGGMNSSDATDAVPIPASTSVQVRAITINPLIADVL